jgi:phosphate transport system substrate-binding protein
VIAFDGLAVIVNRSNPIADPKRSSPFSMARLSRILAGEIVDWSELGGERGTIRLHLPNEQSAISKALDEQVMRPQRKRIAANSSKYLSGAEIAAAIGRDRSALGVVSIGDTGPATALPLGLSCGLIYHPSVFSVQTQAYPLTNRIFAYTFGQPAEPLADEFIKFISSESASEAIRSSGLIDTLTRVEERQDTDNWLS